MEQSKQLHPDLIRGDNIKIPGHVGTWYVAFTRQRRGQTFYYLEHEFYGDQADMIIVDKEKKIIRENVR